MSATKLKVGAVAVVVLATAAVIVWQQQQANRFRAEAAMLREQLAQAVSLQAENQRLAGELAASAERSQANLGELMRLRAKAGTLRATEQENARLKTAAERERERAAKPTPPAPEAPPEEDPYEKHYGPGFGVKMSNSKQLGLAILLHAAEHDGQFPQSFAEAAAAAPPERQAQFKQLDDQFEILYHGLQKELTSPPPEAAIIVRSRQAWRRPDGKWAKIYVYGNGAVTTEVTADGNFDEWERIRIPKPNAK